MKDNQVYEVPLGDIDISDFNVRHHGARTDLEELKASIQKHGLLQPVVLLGELGKPRYKLIAGQRRFLAHVELGLPHIRGVFERDLSETEIIVRSLVENVQRLDLDYADAASAITKLYATYNNDDRRVAEETGLSLRRVRDYISLEAMATPKMKEMLKANTVTPADAKRALRAAASDAAKAESLLELIAEYRPTTNQKKRIVEFGERNAVATAQEIVEKAFAPHVEETIVLALPPELHNAIKAAMQEMNLEAEDFALRAIREWLHEKGFIDQDPNQ
jgi:ParB family transcriptional regulator, chromosome partitioning protein